MIPLKFHQISSIITSTVATYFIVTIYIRSNSYKATHDNTVYNYSSYFIAVSIHAAKIE